MPVSRINAHSSKVHGIDWSRDVGNEIVTCSLDKTIKVWDTHTFTEPQEGLQPKSTIHTTYPIWRARNIPFGRGVLSLPQKGEAALEMYALDNSQTPVETFDVQADIVKEFVWRRGGQGWQISVACQKSFEFCCQTERNFS